MTRGARCNTPNFRIGSGLKFSNQSSNFWNQAGLENMDNKLKYRPEFFFMKNCCVGKRAVSKTGYAISIWVFYARKVSCFGPRNSKLSPIVSIPLPLDSFF